MRSDGVQVVLGWLLGTYMWLVLRTVRWRHENVACVEPVLAGPSGAIALFWHGRIPLGLAPTPQWSRKRTKCLISPSADGEFIARALAMSGFGAIRASSAKPGDAAKARAAIGAVREAVAFVSGGGALVISPDGPRGPNERIAPGALQIARRSGQPVYLMGIAAHPAWQSHKSWDRVMFPAPFGRGAVVWEGPLHVPADADDTRVAALIEDWSARLSAATRRAEAMVNRPLPLTLYRAATALLAPVAPSLLRARAPRGKEDPARIGERLGRPGVARPEGPLVWLHGVSLGEATSLLPLVAALRERRPDLTILVTSGTVTSAALLARRLPAGVIHQYAPVDTPGAVRRFLDHWRPGLGILVESELWPNLILGARARGVRLAMVSARMTARSADGWARWPASAATVLGAFDLILAQDDATEARLRRLGALPGPRLNLKLIGEPPPVDDAELERLRAATEGRRVVLAASTHPGEEPLIANAVRKTAPEAVLILAPRHPERGPEIAEMLGASLRSRGEPMARVYVADTLGELGTFMRLADVVVMGGSFVPGIGGHNPLEPARFGRPILTGRYAFNAADVYAEMFAQACAIEAADGAALTRHLTGLLQNPTIARRMGEAALVYANRQGAALEEAMTLLEPLLPA